MTRRDFTLRSVLIPCGMVVLDGIVLAVLILAMASWRSPSVLSPLSLTALAVPLFCLWAFLFLIDGYQARHDMSTLNYSSEHLIAVTGALLATLFVSFIVITDDFPLKTSRGMVVGGFILFAPLSLYYRRTLSFRLQRRRKKRLFFFLGSKGEAADFLYNYPKNNGDQQVHFLAVSPGEAGQTVLDDGNIRLLPDPIGAIDQNKGHIDGVIMAHDSLTLHPDLLEKLVELHLENVPVFTTESFFEAKMRKIPLAGISPRWLLKNGFEIARDPVFEHFKRISDIVFAVGGLALFLPFAPFVVLAIKTESKGSVFYRQMRVGKRGTVFHLLKFRTMHPGSDQTLDYTEPTDARITRVGRLLRKIRFDEVPQLWNVLRGDMSLIGPRAEWVKYVEEYEKNIPFYHFRHLVKPGITGWAQVNYPYGECTEDAMKKLEYDLYYIRHFSFLLDASILLKTIHTVLFGKGR